MIDKTTENDDQLKKLHKNELKTTNCCVDEWVVDHRKLMALSTYHGYAGGIDSLAWSPDGKRIASSSTDNTVQVWEVS